MLKSFKHTNMTDLNKFTRVGRFLTALSEVEENVNSLMNSLKAGDLNDDAAFEQLKPCVVKLNRICCQDSHHIWGYGYIACY